MTGWIYISWMAQGYSLTWDTNMWLFFTSKKWLLWSWIGAIAIIGTMWYQVQLDVQINEWFGDFYNLIQTALANPGQITLKEYFMQLLTFAKIAAIYIAVALAVAFFTSHWLFRWRTSMVEWYHSVYDKAASIEGCLLYTSPSPRD